MSLRCAPPAPAAPPTTPGAPTRGRWVQGGDTRLHVRQEGRLDVLTRGRIGGDATARRHGRRGVPSQRRAGVPRQRPARLRRHRAPSAPSQARPALRPTPPGAGTHPVDGRLAVGAKAGALPVELVSRLQEEECCQGLAPGDGRHPAPLPRARCLPMVPCNRVRSCLRWRGTGPCPAAACGQGRRGMERRAEERWGHTGHRPERTARPGGTAVPGIPAGPGGSQHRQEKRVPAHRGPHRCRSSPR